MKSNNCDNIIINNIDSLEEKDINRKRKADKEADNCLTDIEEEIDLEKENRNKKTRKR